MERFLQAVVQTDSSGSRSSNCNFHRNSFMSVSSRDSHGEEVHEVYTHRFTIFGSLFSRDKASLFSKMQCLTPILTQLGTLALL